MLQYTVLFMIVAIIAAIFGFTGIAGGATAVVQLLCYVFLGLFVTSFLLCLLEDDSRSHE